MQLPSTSPQAALPRIHFTTAPSTGREAFERWLSRVDGYYDGSAMTDSEAVERFRIETTHWHLGEMVATRSAYSRREQSRPLKKIRSDQVDHYRLVLQLQGSLRVDADGRRVVVEPGQLLLTDMARPELYSIDEGHSILLFLPREALDGAMPRPLDLHGVVPRGVGAAMLAAHVKGLAEHLDSATVAEAPSIAQATMHLIAAAVAPAAATASETARAGAEASLLRQACRYVELHLTDTELSAQTLCTVLKVSRATLYRMFEPLGGVNSFIKERRLLRIHALLAAPSQRQHLATLADEHGFTDASHLSRCFRQMFGYSPSEARGQAAPPSGAPAPAAADALMLGDWLRSLRS